MSDFQYPEPYQNLPAEQLNLERGVTKRGWMLKKSGRNKIPFTPLSNYDKRFFILLKGWVYYYKDLNSKTPQGVFSLQGYSNRVIAAEEERCTALPFVFKVYPKSADGRTYYFAPEVEADMNSWRDCFKQEIEKYNITANNLRMSRSLPEKRQGNSPGSPTGPTQIALLGDTKRPNSFTNGSKQPTGPRMVGSSSVASSHSTSTCGSIQSLPNDDVDSPQHHDHVFVPDDRGYYEEFDTPADPNSHAYPPPRPSALPCDMYEDVSTNNQFPLQFNRSPIHPLPLSPKLPLDRQSSFPTELPPQPPSNKNQSKHNHNPKNVPSFANKTVHNTPNRPKPTFPGTSPFQNRATPHFTDQSQAIGSSLPTRDFSPRHNSVMLTEQGNYELPDQPMSPIMSQRPAATFNDALDREMMSRTTLPALPGQEKPAPVPSRTNKHPGMVDSVYEDMEDSGLYQDTEEPAQTSFPSQPRTKGGFNLTSPTTSHVTSRIAKIPLPPTKPTSTPDAVVTPTLPSKPRSKTELLQSTSTPTVVEDKKASSNGKNFAFPIKPLTPKPDTPLTPPKPAVKPNKPLKPTVQKPPTALKPRSQSKPVAVSTAASSGGTAQSSIAARGQMFGGAKPITTANKSSDDEVTNTVSARARMFDAGKKPMKPPTGLKPAQKQPVSYRR